MSAASRDAFSRPVFDQTIRIQSNHAQRLLDRGFLLVVRALYGIDVVLRIIGDDEEMDQVEEIVGSDDPPGVAGVRVRDVDTGATRMIEAKGVFIAIGHTPNTELFRGQLRMDGEGYIVTAPDRTATNVPGVFAAGDVQDKIYRQAVTAAGTGCMAALEAEKFLAEHETATVAAQ